VVMIVVHVISHCSDDAENVLRRARVRAGYHRASWVWELA
jgi:hypothetical protein